MPGNERPTRWLIALAAMAAAIPLLPAALGRTVVDSPFTFDIGNQWIGFAQFVRDSYLGHRFPLWDPHDLCGTPFLAFAHTGSLYLPAVLAHLALPGYSAAAAVDIFLHLFLAAASAFLFLRRDGRSQPAAFAGAMIYAFSGFVFGNINFPPSLHSAAWLPLWYAGAFALLDRPRLKDAALAALGLAAMIYGGDLEMVVFGGLGLALAAGLKLRRGELRPAAAAALGLALIAGLLPALPQLLPAAELQSLSIRAGGAFTPAVSPLPWLAAPALMLVPVPEPPSLYPPNHGLDSRYLGAMALLLIVWALRSPRARRPLWALPAVAVYFLLFYVPPLNRIFAHVPVLGGLMVPFRLQPALWLFLLLTVTRALDEWAQAQAGPAAADLLPGGRGGGTALLVFAGATAVSLVFFRQAIAARTAFALILGLAGLAALRPATAPAAVFARRRYLLPLLLIFADLYLFALACAPRTDPATLAPDPRAAPILAGTAGRERYLIYSIRGIIDPGLPYHLGLRIDADTIDSFTRLPPTSAALRLAKLYPALLRRENGRLLQYDQMAPRDPQQMDRGQLGLLNALNVRWLVGRFAWPHGPGPLDLKPVFTTPPGDPDPLFVYRNDAAWPRATAQRAGTAAAVPVDHPWPDAVELGPLPADGGTVSLSESGYPGWRAFAGPDGAELKIDADGNGLRTVRPAGPGRTVMRFEPVSFRVGLWAGLASIAAASILAGARAGKGRRAPGPT